MDHHQAEIVEFLPLEFAALVIEGVELIIIPRDKTQLFYGDNLSHRDVAKWARTSVQMVADFYDQNVHGSGT